MKHLKNNKLNGNDIEYAKQINETLIEFKNLLDGHATSNKNYPRKIEIDLYARNYYNLLIFDELIDGEYCEINLLRNKISHKRPKDFDNRYSHELAFNAYELCKRQLVEYKITNNKYLLKITQKGIEAYNDNTFHDLAISSFYGFQAYKLSRNSFFIAIVAISLSILTLFITLVKDQTFSINESQLKSIKSDLQNIGQKILPEVSKTDITNDTLITRIVKIHKDQTTKQIK